MNHNSNDKPPRDDGLERDIEYLKRICNTATSRIPIKYRDNNGEIRVEAIDDYWIKGD